MISTSDNNLIITLITCQFPVQSQSHYFSPHCLNQYSRCLNKDRLQNSLAIVHNNITSLNRNPEKLTLHYLDEIYFLFNIIGVTETKIRKSNEVMCTPKTPGYNFEHLPTPLASGGVCLFIDDALNYAVIEKTSGPMMNMISDVSDHFSQFSILTSARDKVTKRTIKKRDFS